MASYEAMSRLPASQAQQSISVGADSITTTREEVYQQSTHHSQREDYISPAVLYDTYHLFTKHPWFTGGWKQNQQISKSSRREDSYKTLIRHLRGLAMNIPLPLLPRWFVASSISRMLTCLNLVAEYDQTHFYYIDRLAQALSHVATTKPYFSGCTTDDIRRTLRRPGTQPMAAGSTSDKPRGFIEMLWSFPNELQVMILTDVLVQHRHITVLSVPVDPDIPTGLKKLISNVDNERRSRKESGRPQLLPGFGLLKLNKNLAEAAAYVIYAHNTFLFGSLTAAMSFLQQIGQDRLLLRHIALPIVNPYGPEGRETVLDIVKRAPGLLTIWLQHSRVCDKERSVHGEAMWMLPLIRAERKLRPNMSNRDRFRFGVIPDAGRLCTVCSGNLDLRNKGNSDYSFAHCIDKPACEKHFLKCSNLEHAIWAISLLDSLGYEISLLDRLLR